MKAILTDLIETIAARGAMVVAPDGFLVASDVREGVDADRLGALGATIVTQVSRSLAEGGLEPFTQVEVAAENGKVIVVKAGPTWLLVLLGARLEVGPGSIEIKSAAQRIAKAAELVA
jgi:predicted regulator of Ras-like GTPase activity (Roadblock/LC7/MglB family)